MAELCPLERVRASCAHVMRKPRAVSIEEEPLRALAQDLVRCDSAIAGCQRAPRGAPNAPKRLHHAAPLLSSARSATRLSYLLTPKVPDLQKIKWDSESAHFTGEPDDTIQYLLVLDAINFCFWRRDGDPGEQWEYEPLAAQLRAAVLRDRTALSAENLAAMTPEALQEILGGKLMPQHSERVRLLREVGCELARSFQGSAAHLVRAAKGSASRLVWLITAHFPGFRDESVYHGEQVFFYKRAQIFVADVFGAFAGEGIGHFDDIDRVTMFADYRVPQILAEIGVLKYDSELAKKITNKEMIPFGAAEESEIRAATVCVVEQIVDFLRSSGTKVCAFQVDWLLWQRGERVRDEIMPHHRTPTIFY